MTTMLDENMHFSEGRKACLIIVLMMEASETSVYFSEAIPRYIPQGCLSSGIFLNSYIFKFFLFFINNNSYRD